LNRNVVTASSEASTPLLNNRTFKKYP